MLDIAKVALRVACGALFVATAGACAESEPDLPPQLAPEAELLAAESPVVVPPQDAVRFTTVQLVGEGCGRAEPEFNSAKTKFTVGFSRFEVKLAPGQKQNDITCQVVVGLSVPKGYKVAVSRYGYSLFARLVDGLRGELLATYGFAGVASPIVVKPKPIAGTPEGALESFADNVTALSYSTCGTERLLRIGLTLSITNPTNDLSKDGQLTFHYASGVTGPDLQMDSLVKPVEVLLAWEKC